MKEEVFQMAQEALVEVATEVKLVGMQDQLIQEAVEEEYMAQEIQVQVEAEL